MVSEIKKHQKVVLGVLLFLVSAVLAWCLLLSPGTGTAAGKEMPEAMKELSQAESVEWMAGLWVEFPNCDLLQRDNAPDIEAYFCAESSIRAIVTLQNGLDSAQPYYLMVFADGIPMEFSVGKGAYQAYPLELTSEQQALELEFRPEFSLGMGRLDFLLFFDGNPKSDFHMTSYTVCIEQPEAAHSPVRLQAAVEQREGIRDSFTNEAYGAWLWNENAPPASTDGIGPREIAIRQGERLRLEAITGRPGLYRTVLMLDGQPVSFTVEGENYDWVDWEADGANMLQIPMELPEELAAHGSFFTIATPLGTDSMSLNNLASFKMQIVDSLTGEE